MSFLCPEANDMLHYSRNVRAAIPILEIYDVETHKKRQVKSGKEKKFQTKPPIVC